MDCLRSPAFDRPATRYAQADDTRTVMLSAVEASCVDATKP
jgi:hypothetical protein